MNIKKNIVLVLAIAIALVFSMVVPVFAADTETQIKNVGTASELVKILTDTTKLPVVYKNLTINITADIDVSGIDWTPGFVNGYCGAQVYTIEGNGHKITGLTNSLIGGTWAGRGNLVINNLTIANSNMVATGSAFGAFISSSEATPVVTLNNCHLIDSTITGDNWTGGLIGYAAGYSNQNDGPVFESISIKNCSVKNSSIKGNGSTGAIIGHATGDAWTKVEIKNCIVTGNTITCIEEGRTNKAGDLIGTVGVAGNTVYGKTGGVFVDATVSDNTVTSAGQRIDRIFGRFGSAGILTVTGGKYDWSSFEGFDKGTLKISGGKFQADPSSYVVEGEVVNNNGTYVVCTHEWTTHNDVEPTCTKEGNVKYYVCDNCGIIEIELDGKRVRANIEDTKVNAKGHILTNVKEVKPTYVKEGNKAYWVCECGAYFEDAEGKEEITDKTSVILPKLIKIEESKAEVSKDAIDEAIEESKEKSDVVIDLQQTQETVKDVIVPTNSLNKVVEEEKELTVKTTDAVVTFDNKALQTVVKDAENSESVFISVKKSEETKLNNEQKEAIKDKKVAAVISAEILIGNKKVSNFDGGKVTVKIPFTPEENTKGTDYKVIYISDDGKIEEIDTEFIDGHIVVKLAHFSEYAIVKKEDEVKDDKKDDTTVETEKEDKVEDNTQDNINKEEEKDNTQDNINKEEEKDNTQDNINKEEEKNETESITPKTGDSIILYVSVLVIAVVAMGIVIYKKVNNNVK